MAHNETRSRVERKVSEGGNIVTETAARIFADLADPQTVNRAKDGTWKGALWTALADAGLTLAWVPDELGGAGASLADGFEVLGVAGRFAAPVPITETLLAGWLLSAAGIPSPAGPMTIAPARPGDVITRNADGTLSGRVRCVPFGRDAEHIAVFATGPEGGWIALVETGACRVLEGRNLAGDASNTVIFERTKPIQAAPAPPGFTQQSLMLMGCVVRAVQTAGALEASLAMTVAYANERVAFERPIAKFQAIQHNLARLAGEVAAAVTAAHSAADAIGEADTPGDAILLEAASAKIRCAEAAQEGAAIAHQTFGAIGFTQEHVLHRFTLRMLAWRDDFGNESHWAVELGNRIAARGADAFWPLVASR